ncbi:putative Reverse transcriptase (RNA-dependent DNA polymerase) [Monocercomonoides exilis]|uniref:putative Reverse transcriptase (RNA-dependent DNA polymerase) n=1 Tax=Monocercomonoides exilis TaxID=2049356 RepID=UPI0035593D8B|nr:putative Reverse transcriptase (RNA-dependent DNA polymerase) [Monocercomonoides exilis]|eukprot:MONOS_13718.1-p1 / transcript=MONOS_13718.1 / gene=MONOS_13718 / organism=Monocercomonoides_exilis_PA203 / gene_product=unspecified product / transcript_product=unspecified product / location=Mono_scaffold00871:5703-6410(-) / protein_length=235 / sequence_SO=supercontig / SO=protein_coding / is_pseudo=false
MKRFHFNCESERAVEHFIQNGDYAITLDLAQAYCLIPVSPDFKPYLSFTFEGTDYSFVGMPFGFMDAPRIFTKIMRKETRAIKEKWNVRVIAYLDDMIILQRNREYLEIIKSEVLLLLESLGLMVHKDKCQLESTTKKSTYLGFDCDTEEFTARLEKDKAFSLAALLCLWEKKSVMVKQVRIKDFASLIGKINAVRFVRQDASLRMVALHRLFQKNVRTSGWSWMMKMNTSVLKE